MNWTWHIDAAWTPFFQGKECPDWLDLAHDPRATRVKSHEGREVWRIDLPGSVSFERSGAGSPTLGLEGLGMDAGQTLFAKLTRAPRRWARSQRLLLGSHAAREWRAARYAGEHQIPAVHAIAAGEGPSHDRPFTSILVTIGLPNAQPLDTFWLTVDPASVMARRIKNQVIDAVSQLIAYAHQNGFEHFDLHAGNILIQPHATRRTGETPVPQNAGNILIQPWGTGCRASFVDLLNVRTARPVKESGVIRNLAQLNQWFQLHATLADRMRFFDRYLSWRESVASKSAYARAVTSDQRSLLDQLAVAIRSHARALDRQRDRRMMRSGRYFTELALGGGWRGHAFLAAKHPVAGSRASGMIFTPRQWKDWLSHPADRVSPTDRSSIIKDSPTAMVCRDRLDLGDGESLDVVCKRARPRNMIKRLVYLFRTSRPMLTWKRANALLHRQIPTARPLAVLERRRLGLLLDSMILTEYIEHAQDLDTLLTVRLREVAPPRQRLVKRQVAEDLAAMIRRLHERGFTHRDLKASNVMVQWHGESERAPQVMLVDLDGLRRRTWTSAAHELRALTRLNVSLDHCKRVTLADRLRFLKRYLAGPGRPDPQWRPAWENIARRSQRKREQLARQHEKLLKQYATGR